MSSEHLTVDKYLPAFFVYTFGYMLHVLPYFQPRGERAIYGTLARDAVDVGIIVGGDLKKEISHAS